MLNGNMIRRTAAPPPLPGRGVDEIEQGRGRKYPKAPSPAPTSDRREKGLVDGAVHLIRLARAREPGDEDAHPVKSEQMKMMTMRKICHATPMAAFALKPTRWPTRM